MSIRRRFRCDLLCTTTAVQAHSVLNTNFLKVALIQHTFTCALPMPKPEGEGGKGKKRKRAPMYDCLLHAFCSACSAANGTVNAYCAATVMYYNSFILDAHVLTYADDFWCRADVLASIEKGLDSFAAAFGDGGGVIVLTCFEGVDTASSGMSPFARSAGSFPASGPSEMRRAASAPAMARGPLAPPWCPRRSRSLMRSPACCPGPRRSCRRERPRRCPRRR